MPFSEKASEETAEPVPEGLELDEEGYVIRKDSDSVNSGRNEDSDSDSDTDSGMFFFTVLHDLRFVLYDFYRELLITVCR